MYSQGHSGRASCTDHCGCVLYSKPCLFNPVSNTSFECVWSTSHVWNRINVAAPLCSDSRPDNKNELTMLITDWWIIRTNQTLQQKNAGLSSFEFKHIVTFSHKCWWTWNIQRQGGTDSVTLHKIRHMHKHCEVCQTAPSCFYYVWCCRQHHAARSELQQGSRNTLQTCCG